MGVKCPVQVQQARLESEEHRLKLEVVQKEAREAKANLEREKERVRRELLGRLRELEPLPERLRKTEQQLRDAQQGADVQERKNMENNVALSEVRHKVLSRLNRDSPPSGGKNYNKKPLLES